MTAQDVQADQSIWRKEDTLADYWWLLAVQLLVLVLGFGSVTQRRRWQRTAEFSPVLALETPYVAHAAVYLIAFRSDWDADAYLVLLAAITFIFQAVLVVAGGMRHDHAPPLEALESRP